MFYQPVQESRWFRPGVRYSDIDWNNFNSIISEFDSRIREWYLDPAKCLQDASGHFAFSVMALACLLTDALSQFHGGAVRSHQDTFKNFVRQNFPEFARALPVPIRRPNSAALMDFADVLYHGFRCGILHEAHIEPYGVLCGQSEIVSCAASGFTVYQDGADCPTVIIYPKLFLDALELFLATYVSRLLDPDEAFNDLRANFKKKFNAAFGIDITNAA